MLLRCLPVAPPLGRCLYPLLIGALGLQVLASNELAPVAHACATVGFTTQPVQIADEAAIIVWDEARHIEHFIRRARFKTAAKDFGFLVPTPNTPTLSEVGDEAFARLDKVITPPVVEVGPQGIQWVSWMFPQRKFQTAANSITTTTTDVQVLQSQQVGGYDAVTLAADDPQALTTWLRRHGYVARPATTAWLRPYTQAHWKITAFKIAHAPATNEPEADPNDITSAAVKMSFATDHPFFPYREPADQRDPHKTYDWRLLRVFFLAPKRVDGVVGQKGKPQSWPGRVMWANRLDDANLSGLTQELGLTSGQLSSGTYLTAFDDTSSPRPGTDDVYFAASQDQSTYTPPPIPDYRDHRIKVPVEIVGLIPLLGVGLLRRRREPPARPRSPAITDVDSFKEGR
ncbi:MAG: DUF2330 domain-containing protein [Abitibacteriaceae bacterium]|nr:DUF2330 domain-containing protein [Abditibacteriaceae bacterium]